MRSPVEATGARPAETTTPRMHRPFGGFASPSLPFPVPLVFREPPPPSIKCALVFSRNSSSWLPLLRSARVIAAVTPQLKSFLLKAKIDEARRGEESGGSCLENRLQVDLALLLGVNVGYLGF